jgi:hypothetical protein
VDPAPGTPEDSWAACREIVEFRKSEIQQGDNVSTRVFD